MSLGTWFRELCIHSPGRQSEGKRAAVYLNILIDLDAHGLLARGRLELSPLGSVYCALLLVARRRGFRCSRTGLHPGGCGPGLCALGPLPPCPPPSACVRRALRSGGAAPGIHPRAVSAEKQSGSLAVGHPGSHPRPQKATGNSWKPRPPGFPQAWPPVGPMAALLLVSTASQVDGSYNPFLYLRF